MGGSRSSPLRIKARRLDRESTLINSAVVFVRLGNLLLIVALLAATNAHWAVLQSVAWTTMLANNLRHDSFTDAVTCTFDGRHPCCLCKAIAAAKQSGKKTECTSPTPKLEFPPLKQNVVLIAPSQFQLLLLSNAFADSRVQTPPLPPPRGFFA